MGPWGPRRAGDHPLGASVPSCSRAPWAPRAAPRPASELVSPCSPGAPSSASSAVSWTRARGPSRGLTPMSSSDPLQQVPRVGHVQAGDTDTPPGQARPSPPGGALSSAARAPPTPRCRRAADTHPAARRRVPRPRDCGSSPKLAARRTCVRSPGRCSHVAPHGHADRRWRPAPSQGRQPSSTWNPKARNSNL